MVKHTTQWVKKWLQSNRKTARDMRDSFHRYDGKARANDSDMIEEMRTYTAAALKYISSNY